MKQLMKRLYIFFNVVVIFVFGFFGITKAQGIDSIKNASLYLDSGNTYFRVINYIEAIKYYNKSIQLNPKLDTAYYKRGLMEYDLNYPSAIADFNKAIEINPKYEYAYVDRGLAKGAFGNNIDAIKDFDKAIELNPGDMAAYYEKGRAYNHLGNFFEALKDLNKAIELAPQFCEAYYYRGLVYDNMGKYYEAIKDYTKAIELNYSDYEKAYNNRGASYIKLVLSKVYNDVLK
jgi:tetratricopeptide (TPR) repeat protein